MGNYVGKIYGPPGTGKTTFLMKMVQDEIKAGTWPQRIAFTSFTKAAAYHARDLIIQAYPEYEKQDFLNFGTLHSIAFRLLGLRHDKVFQKHDFARAYPIYKFTGDGEDDSQLLDEYHTQTSADYCEAFLNWSRNMMIGSRLEAFRQFKSLYSDAPDPFSVSYLEDYLWRRDEYKRREGKYDFCDMLEICLREGLAPDIDVFIADEGQDSSRVHFEIFKMWSDRAKISYYAGDAYQAIYGFQGSDPSLMIDLKADDEFTLKQSYRVPRVAHDLARTIVTKFKLRYPDDDFKPTEREGTIRKISSAGATLDYPGKTFVLFRTRYLLEQQFERLYQKGIPFSTRRGRKSPLDKKEREVAKTLLRLSRDESIPLGVLVDILDKIPSRVGKVVFVKHGAKKDLEERVKEDRISRDSLPFLGFTTSFMGLLNDKDFIELIRTDADTKEYFQRLLSRHGTKAFLVAPSLILGTIHSVKGLEADNVLLSLEMTTKPMECLIRDWDSEGRIFYVGVTRTRNNLEVLIPDSYKRFNI